MNGKKTYLNIFLVLILLIGLNIAGSVYYKRFDLTHDKRYTLSDETERLINEIEKPMSIKVYLQGSFPAEFKRLQLETNQLLKEFNEMNELIQFRFIDPMSSSKELVEKGLQPSRLTVQEDGKVSEEVIFPWAVISYGQNEENVPLLVSALAPSQEQQLQNSIENLEYEFANAIHKISQGKSKTIAVLKGNGQPDDVYLFSFLKKLGEYYKLAEFTMDSVSNNPAKTFEQLSAYDLSIIVKPSKRFEENEKLVLDQYIANGGKTLWLLDNVYAEMDSLMTSGTSLAFNRDLNLTDMLFSYGVRINYNVTKDLYSSSIRLAAGNTGNQVQYQNFPWLYFPLVFADNSNPITRNLDPVLLKFPSSIDTLDNGIKKTLLLQSSPLAKIIGTPVNISLNEVAIPVDKEKFKDAQTNYAVLLEGSFNSAYSNRVLPFELDNYKPKSVPNQMIIVSDGDVAVNEVMRNEPLPLSQDKWTGQNFGNEDFLLNSAHYLLDDSGLLQLRGKSLQIQFLDKEKAYSERNYWQLLNIVIPLIALFLFGLLFNWNRKRKYS
ncbi:gliding motility-associated ABC transporter substrate-binding protein GldG [Lutimonas zeaxanthinifaciens]|uniref:gliding motility-associated ABC transporter substrate-binding protein GldG n=1 Tax=Lutimonas zeaxanthinifaciens TaxID=3060215 RepID=UPI00265D4144|nr:gliding motility-associated ABC transporter substrate-binding protein GldG [Lutimonas sp. YSD2104]WKK66848.1 gliding motility-associated ABC transporter substrate-binding protein GldG [Lutimonas sp. YSD2104]